MTLNSGRVYFKPQAMNAQDFQFLADEGKRKKIEANMQKITIIFGTEMGTAEGCANQISELLTACSLENEVVDMGNYEHERLAEPGVLLVITSTSGNGVPPSTARALHSHLAQDNPQLAGRKFAVLSLGDSFRTYFAQCGKDFDRMLEELGGQRIIERIDCDGAVASPLAEFEGKLLDYFEGQSEDFPSFVRSERPAKDRPRSSAPSGNAQGAKREAPKKSILSRLKRRVKNKIRSLL